LNPDDSILGRALTLKAESFDYERLFSKTEVDPGTGMPSASLRACDTVPVTNTPGFWCDRLMARPDIEGALSESDWQVCDFPTSMTDVRNRLENLIAELDANVN